MTLALAAAVALLAVACGSELTPTGASGPAETVSAASPAASGSSASGSSASGSSASGSSASGSSASGSSTSGRSTGSSATVQASGRDKIDICHRTRWGYIPITVSEAALAGHLGHGDAAVGGAVPDQEGMVFDATCTAVPSGGTTLIGGFFDGRTSFPSGGFTLVAAGLVSAYVTVTSGYDLPTPLHLELLGFNPTVTAREQCSAQWLAAPVAPGPSMPGPALVGHWVVPPGSYCVVVAGQNLPPLNWSGSVIY